MRVSLVLTVRNEAASIETLLSSIAGQRRLPDEIVVVDGGSADGTVGLVRRHGSTLAGVPLRLIEASDCNIAQGRNLAIRTAEYDLLAVTDAGVALDRWWLQRLMEPFMTPSPSEVPALLATRPDVVSGYFVPAPRSTFELALGATTLPLANEIHPERYLPSSRSVAFTRDAWLRAAGYPEWLDYCEDLVFDLALRRAGCRFATVREAICYYRPRPTPQAFFRQYYRYARGDGKADLWRSRHAIRYTAYISGALMLVAARSSPWVLGPLALGAYAYLRRPLRRLRRLWQGYPLATKVQAAAWVPLIRTIGDVAKMIGYPVGWMARLRDPDLAAGAGAR